MSLIQDGKEIVEAGTGQASHHLEIMKKKLKIYGLQNKIEVEMTKLGEIVFNLIQAKEKDVFKNDKVAKLVESIKEQKEEIQNTEKEILGDNKEIEGAKKRFFETSRDFFEVIKKGFGGYESNDLKEKEKADHSEILDQKKSTVVEEPVESRKTKKTTAKKTAPKKTAVKKKATVEKKKIAIKLASD